MEITDPDFDPIVMERQSQANFKKWYQQEVRRKVNEKVNLTEFNRTFRRELCQLYRDAVKKVEETVEDWTERVGQLEAKLINSHKVRQELGVIMTRSWEVSRKPGLIAYDFFVDWEEIDRDGKERKFLRYIQNKREEYLQTV